MTADEARAISTKNTNTDYVMDVDNMELSVRDCIAMATKVGEFEAYWPYPKRTDLSNAELGAMYTCAGSIEKDGFNCVIENKKEIYVWW